MRQSIKHRKCVCVWKTGAAGRSFLKKKPARIKRPSCFSTGRAAMLLLATRLAPAGLKHVLEVFGLCKYKPGTQRLRP